LKDPEDSQEIQSIIFSKYLGWLLIACKYNLLEELNELLAVFILFDKNIRDYTNPKEVEFKLPMVDQPLCVTRGQGDYNTLLGIASFHGHPNLVKYLVEEHKANVNQSSFDGYSPLHSVVLGSNAPSDKTSRRSYGTQHAEVAQYLINHSADIAACRHGKTPLQLAEENRPFLSFLYSNPVLKVLRDAHTQVESQHLPEPQLKKRREN
jgi:hypothetical protein